MIFRNHRAGATLFPPHVLRLDRSTAPAAGFQRTAKYHTVHRLSQMEAPRVVFRTLQVPFGKSIINNSPRMRCNIHTGDPTAVMKPSPLSDQSYHEMADLYFEALLEEVDELREKGSNIIAEYSVCLFLHFRHPPPCLEGAHCAISAFKNHPFSSALVKSSPICKL